MLGKDTDIFCPICNVDRIDQTVDSAGNKIDGKKDSKYQQMTALNAGNVLQIGINQQNNIFWNNIFQTIRRKRRQIQGPN